MVKPLSFKGDKKVKKRKRTEDVDPSSANANTTSASTSSAAARVNVDEDDGWINAEEVSDIAGPIASSPPTCIATDANGKIFASPLENITDADTSTAEPHDVRQVWVTTRIPDTNRFCLKGHHGRYLTIDKLGFLSATKEAISPEEELTLSKTETRGWSLMTVRDKFVSAEEVPGGKDEVIFRGDAETVGFGQNWTVRMQRRFRKRPKKEGEIIKDKISRKDLENLAGQELDDDQVKKLKKARREGNLQSTLLDIRQKGKRDKFAY